MKWKCGMRVVRLSSMLAALAGAVVLFALQTPSAAYAATCVAGDSIKPCQDVFESNDAPANSKPLSASLTISLTFFNTVDDVNDVDWYQAAIGPFQIYTLTVSTLNTNGDIQIAGFTNGGQTPIGIYVNYGQIAVAAITNTDSMTRTFYFRVNNAANNFYYYQAQVKTNFVPIVIVPIAPFVTPAPNGAGPDYFENNDTPALVLQRLSGIVSYINIGTQIANANFYPNNTLVIPITAVGELGDVDWYYFYGKKSLALADAIESKLWFNRALTRICRFIQMR